MTIQNFSDQDKIELSNASKTDKPWLQLTNNVKSKIKNYFRGQNNRCCYCHRKFNTDHNAEYDIEHILPESKYKKHCFSFINLNLACIRCNRQIKRDKDIFFKKGGKKFSKSSYLFIHPNLDTYNSHLALIEIDTPLGYVCLYKIKNNSSKGKYTYDFFKLKELVRTEIESAQDMRSVSDSELQNRINSFISALCELKEA